MRNDRDHAASIAVDDHELVAHQHVIVVSGVAVRSI